MASACFTLSVLDFRLPRLARRGSESTSPCREKNEFGALASTGDNGAMMSSMVRSIASGVGGLDENDLALGVPIETLKFGELMGFVGLIGLAAFEDKVWFAE